MTLLENIEELAHKVRTEIYGRDVRESIASSMEATAELAEWSREVAQQIVDGTFNEGALQTEIERKLIELEEQYTPDLNGLKTEVGDARGSELSLGDRLNLVDDQLSKKAMQSDLSNAIKLNSMISYEEYGEIELPEGFPSIPFSFWRDSNGKVQHNFQRYGFVNKTDLYLDTIYGNDLNSGLSPELPVKTITKLIEVANAQSTPDIVVNVLNITDDFRNSHAATAYILTKNMLFKATQKAVFMSGYPNASSRYAWTLDNGAWKVARSNVKAVYDSQFKSYRGHSKKLKLVNSAVECGQQKGTYYTDNVDVWINLPDGRNPTDDFNVQIILESSAKMMFVADGKKIAFENIEVLSRSTDADCLRINGDGSSEITVNNCFFAEGFLNGFYANGCDRVYVLDSDASFNGYDGFNYKGPAISTPTILIFEYNCHAYDNGFSNYYSCNASTAHNGIYVLRIATIGYRCHGPIIADVNGCFSVNYDCVAYDSLVSESEGNNAGFYFDNRQALKNGKVFLFNCKGGGLNTYSMDSDDLIEMNVKNFYGSTVRSNLKFNVLT